MRKFFIAVSLGLVAVGAAGCVSAQAKSADRPALVVPPPPARVIEPAEIVPEPVPDLPTPPSGTPTRPPRRETPPRTQANEAKPDPKPSDPKPVEPIPPPVEQPPPAAPPAQLRTPQTADTSGAAKTVRTTIDTARSLLNSVNFGTLSNERKKAYNDAKLLMQQAEDALKEGNLSFAQGVASKAETLARELAGR
jgi:outer membrane biosynthesis protein TonB